MIRVLLTGAVALTIADAAAFVLLILPGRAVEANGLVLTIGPTAALVAKGGVAAGLLPGVAVLVARSDHAIGRRTAALVIVSLIAILVGAIGTATTVMSALEPVR